MGLYVGLMSGTSMDTVDAVLAEISDGGVSVRERVARPIPHALGERLANALDFAGLRALELNRLDAEVGELFADAAHHLLAHAGIAAEAIDAIGSHGQTLFHAPDDDPALTVQIGNPNIIASRTGITVVADFRRMDMAAGGQGAPLAPLFHRVAFAGPRPRVLLNLGGIANITVLPAAGTGLLRGFDTGPANTLLDLWSARHRAQPYDAGGRWAATGTLRPGLLQRLLAEPYFHREPPKSTGRELFNESWLARALLDRPGLPAEDVQRTLVELTAASVAGAVDAHAADAAEVYTCGGGALNGFLMERLAALMPERRVDTTATLGVPPLAVEGAAFAWLAHERLAGRAAGLGSVTGASRSATLGGIYTP